MGDGDLIVVYTGQPCKVPLNPTDTTILIFGNDFKWPTVFGDDVADFMGDGIDALWGRNT